MTPSSEKCWSVENKETVHEVMTRFLSVQQHPDPTSLTPCCVFTVGVETQLGFPRNTLKNECTERCQSLNSVFTGSAEFDLCPSPWRIELGWCHTHQQDQDQ